MRSGDWNAIRCEENSFHHLLTKRETEKLAVCVFTCASKCKHMQGHLVPTQWVWLAERESESKQRDGLNPEWRSSVCLEKYYINYYTIFLLVLPPLLTLNLVFTWRRLLQSLGFLLVFLLVLVFLLLFFLLLSLIFVCQIIKAFFIQFVVTFGEKRRDFKTDLGLRLVHDSSLDEIL